MRKDHVAKSVSLLKESSTTLKKLAEEASSIAQQVKTASLVKPCINMDELRRIVHGSNS